MSSIYDNYYHLLQISSVRTHRLCDFDLFHSNSLDHSGLQLSLDLKEQSNAEYRPLCGVLVCEETLPDGSSNLKTHRTISGLTIFKTTRDSVTGDGSSSGTNDQGTVFATLSLNKPKLSRVADGVRVDGVLEVGRATLRLEMVKDVDCSALYTCELRTSDDQGNEFVQTNRLWQRPEVGGAQVDGIASGGLFQQLASLQQQLTLMGASLDRKLGDLQKRLDAVENRLEDKILSVQNQMETRVVDKICKIESKLEVACDDDHSGLSVLKEVKENLAVFKKAMDDNQNAVQINVEAISNSASEIVTAVHGQMGEIEKLEHSCHRTTASGTSVNSSEEFSVLDQNIRNDVSGLFGSLQTEFEQLKTTVENSSTVTLKTLHDIAFETNTTIRNILKPVVVDILTPTECARGMFPSLLGTSFPYHVIQPNDKSELDVPYLCDSVTETGGWIVIQRRTTGIEDFYRTWADYREGFGSLYGEFWLGNKHIHALTCSATYELRVDLKYNGKSSYAHYSSFSLDGESNDYILRVGAYDGTAGDSLGQHNGKSFSTYDRDNDGATGNNAVTWSGAWWYYGDHYSNLNSKKWGVSRDTGSARWYSFSAHNSVSFSEMKIRKL